MSQCTLCGSNPAIKNSHVIPKFIFSWLKETSPTGYLRTTENPQVRVQDGLKGEYLCKACEGRFSKLEKHFSETFFQQAILDPTTASVEPQLDSDSMKCILSIMWRSTVHFLATHNSKDHNTQPQDYISLDLARENLRGALDGRYHFKINFMHLTPINIKTFGLASYEENAYFYDRGVAEDVRFDNTGGWVFLKIPRVLFWLHTLKDIGREDPCGAELNIEDLSRVIPFVDHLIQQLHNGRSALSPKQIEKIFDAMKPDEAEGD